MCITKQQQNKSNPFISILKKEHNTYNRLFHLNINDVLNKHYIISISVWSIIVFHLILDQGETMNIFEYK